MGKMANVALAASLAFGMGAGTMTTTTQEAEAHGIRYKDCSQRNLREFNRRCIWRYEDHGWVDRYGNQHDHTHFQRDNYRDSGRNYRRERRWERAENCRESRGREQLFGDIAEMFAGAIQNDPNLTPEGRRVLRAVPDIFGAIGGAGRPDYCRDYD